MLTSDIPAHGKGRIRVPSGKDIRELHISFMDPRGFIAEEEKYEHIQWLIADYSNNGSEKFYRSPHSDRRLVIKDQLLEGKLVLLIK